MLDTLGERYGILPSEVLSRASTLDLYIMDVAMSWHDHQHRKATGQPQDFTKEEMQEMLARARGG